MSEKQQRLERIAVKEQVFNKVSYTYEIRVSPCDWSGAQGPNTFTVTLGGAEFVNHAHGASGSFFDSDWLSGAATSTIRIGA